MLAPSWPAIVMVPATMHAASLMVALGQVAIRPKTVSAARAAWPWRGGREPPAVGRGVLVMVGYRVGQPWS